MSKLTKISLLIVGCLFLFIIFLGILGAKNKVNQPELKNLWTNDQKEEFIDKNSKSTVDRFILNTFLSENETKTNKLELEKILLTTWFQTYKNEKIKSLIIVVDDLANKEKEEIAKILGEPNSKSKVNPSGTSCPCDKYNYLNNLIEIVFLNNKSDWITINNIPSFIKIKNPSLLKSVDSFDDYTYVKVTTE